MIEYKNFKNECGIYCFKNTINGKCYIGQAVNLKKRLRSHYSHYKTGRYSDITLYKAFSKYGIENFDLTILEYVDPNLENLKDKLDNLEKKYIKEYNSYGSTGYNMTIGGDAGVLGLKMTEEQKEKIRRSAIKQNELNKKHIYARNLSESKYYCNLTYKEASEKSKVYLRTIRSICSKKYNKCYCKGWTFALDETTLFNNSAQYFRDIGTGKISLDNNNNSIKRKVIELDK